MFTHTDDDCQILDFLTDVDLRFEKFDTDRVTSFYVGTDYHLLLTFSKVGDKGFHLFTVKDFKLNLEDLNSLRQHLIELDKVKNLEIIKKSIEQVEIHVYAVKALQLLK